MLGVLKKSVFVVVAAFVGLLITMNRPAPGVAPESSLFVMEAFLIGWCMLYLRVCMPDQLRPLSTGARLFSYGSAGVFVAGILMYAVHRIEPGIWLFFIAGAVLGSFVLRVDLLAKSILLESRADRTRRLVIGGSGFAIVFVLGLVSNTPVLSWSAWLVPLGVMFLIIGVLTIRSRMAAAFQLVPEGARERDVQALADFYEGMTAQEMQDKSYQVAALEYTVRQDEMMRRLGAWFYWILYVFLALGTGALVTFILATDTIRPGQGRAAPPAR